MKKNYLLVISLILLAVPIAAIYYFSQQTDPNPADTGSHDTGIRHGNPTAADSPASPSQPRSKQRSVTRNHEAAHLRRELKNTDAQLAKLSGPLNKDMLSSTVNVEIAPGETLATGGYMTPDGNYEITLMTPTSMTMDGKEVIKMSSKVLSVDPDFVKANGLQSLATNARNTLQHAEAWNQKQLETTLRAAAQHGNSGIMSSPTVVSLPSKPSTISIGEAGKTSYSIESTIEKSATGGFAIKARVVRTPHQAAAP